jgi:hypothetical protein
VQWACQYYDSGRKVKKRVVSGMFVAGCYFAVRQLRAFASGMPPSRASSLPHFDCVLPDNAKTCGSGLAREGAGNLTIKTPEKCRTRIQEKTSASLKNAAA